MAKLKSNGTGIKRVDLDSVKLGENVRSEYGDIRSLADSIEKKGQLVAVKMLPDGTLIDGFRRFKAVQLLRSEGKPFNHILATEVKGNRRILQLTFGLQSKNLTAFEKEKAVAELIEIEKMTQKLIAENLGLSKQYVSDLYSSHKKRKEMEEKGVDTSKIAPAVMRKEKKPKIPRVLINCNCKCIHNINKLCTKKSIKIDEAGCVDRE